MDKKYFKVDINDVAELYTQAAFGTGNQYRLLGRTELESPIAGVVTHINSSGYYFGITSLILAKEEILFMPSEFKQGLLPLSDMLVDNFRTRTEPERGFILNYRGIAVYEILSSLMTTSDKNFLGLNVSFGINPFNTMNPPPRKPIDSIDQFVDELHSYAKVLEYTINGFYDEINFLCSNSELCKKIVGHANNPKVQKTLLWKPNQKLEYSVN